MISGRSAPIATKTAPRASRPNALAPTTPAPRQGFMKRVAPFLGFAGSAVAGASTRRHAASTETSAPQQKVQELVQEHSVIMFSKTTCPFCSRAKEVLKGSGSKFVVVELDELPPQEAAAMQDVFADMTGARTVPRIFVRGECLGGCDDLLAIEQQGGLQKVLTGKSFQIQRSEAEWRAKLDPRSYRVLRQQGTEPPGSHQYDRFMPTKGHFACGACGLPLYSASSKFRSNCGWPVFKTCYFSEEAGGCHVGTVQEFGGLEIVCNRCASHLGHVFFDAYKPDNPNGERH
ncbi:MSRB5 [Symbiodinium natans]|uniref:MSRB5 protein n=1 Tax=Symbiodinium natans TaxID=878477 RepID=A0A812RRX3_9DINO|nr:MSRB5 [Symbiodinium natans]